MRSASFFVAGLLFLAPFVDPRRPFRLLHLDLLALLLVAFGSLSYYIRYDLPLASILLGVVCLAYLGVRLLHMGFRPTRVRERLVPLLSARWLAVALLLVIAVRFAHVLVVHREDYVYDVGMSSVLGADRIGDGRELYDSQGDQEYDPHWDTYGPVTYLSYVPFEQVAPWGGDLFDPSGWDDPDAARIAAVTFDLLVLAGLFLLGRRLRPGAEGRLLGLALAYAWATYPLALFDLRYNGNDTLVAVFVLGAFLALTRPAVRGASAALAALTKFGPAVIAPLFATGTGEHRRRDWILFGAAFVAVALASLVPLLPPGGLDELWDRTLGYQQGRSGFNSIWDPISGVRWLQTIAQVAVAGLAVLLAFVPRRRSPLQVAALGAGLMAIMQLTMSYWFAAYVVWFAPLAFAALFAVHDTRPLAGSPHAEPPKDRRPAEQAAAPG